MSMTVNGVNSTTYDPATYSASAGRDASAQTVNPQEKQDETAATYEPSYPTQSVSLRRVELSAEENEKLQASLSAFTSAKQKGLALYSGVLALYGADNPNAANKVTSPEVEAARVVKPDEYNALKDELKDLERVYAETGDQEGWMYGVSKAYDRFKAAAGNSDEWMEAYRTAFGDRSEGSQWEQLYGRFGEDVSVKDGTKDDPLTNVFSGSKRMNLMLAPKAVHTLIFGAGNLNQTGRPDYHAIMDNSFANLRNLEETIRNNMLEKAMQDKEEDEGKTDEQVIQARMDRIAAVDEWMKNLRFGAVISEDGNVSYHARIEQPNNSPHPIEASADNTNDLLMALAQRLSE